MNNMPKPALIRAVASLVVIILCILGLVHVIPYNIALPIALIILAGLNIWTGIDMRKNMPEKKSTANITLLSGIFILGIVIFTVIANLVR